MDEFKLVKSELKQLQSEMTIAPKFQLASTVQLYAKVFTSAESVGSLVAENGVEDQFANRMSILLGEGTVNERPVFKKNPVEYARSLKHYIAQTLNTHIEYFVSLGVDGAALKADQVLKDFANQHGLGKHAGRVSDSIPDLAEEFRSYAKVSLGLFRVTRETDGATFLKSPNKQIEEWLEATFTKSEVNTLRRRIPDLIKELSVDDKGIHSYAVDGKRLKGLRIE